MFLLGTDSCNKDNGFERRMATRGNVQANAVTGNKAALAVFRTLCDLADNI